MRWNRQSSFVAWKSVTPGQPTFWRFMAFGTSNHEAESGIDGL
jgi:hypothetical protein